MNQSSVNDNTTQGTAAASYAAAAAIVTIALWVIGMFKIEVPPQVSAAMLVLVGAVMHYVSVRYFSPTTTPVPIGTTSKSGP